MWLAVSTAWTPLHFLCDSRCHNAVVEILRSEQPHSLGPDENGWTPMDCATACGLMPYADRLPLNYMLYRTLKMAADPWSFNSHYYYPASFRAVVFTLLSVEHRLHLLSDANLWEHVLSFASRDWFW